MLISIHDKTLRRVAFIDNEKPETLHFFDDVWHRYLTEATSTFDFSVPKTGNAALQYLTEKNYVSFQYEGQDYLFNIMRTEETESELACYCENLNLELLNEMSPAFKSGGAQTFAWYFNNSDLVGGKNFSDLVLGINEVSDYSRSLEWEGTDTKLARLLSLVNKFDAECEFVTELNRDGSLKRIVLNVYKKHDDTHQGVGTRRQDVTLYYGKEIDGIRRTVDKTGLYNAIYPQGKDGLSITTVEKTEYDADGRVLYYTHNGQPYIYAPQTAEEYSAQISSKDDPWILYRWEYETENVNTLYGQALAKLKEISAPAVTYEVEGSLMLEIGDTVKIHDDKFMPTLLLEARVSEQEVSFSDPTKNKNVFSNFKALENKLSTDITGRLDQLIQEALPYTAEILSDNGTVFRNGEGETTLTARVLKGNVDVTNQVGLHWSKDTVEVSTDQTITVTAAEVHEKTLYRLSAINGSGEEVCFAEVTVIDVADGEPGAPGLPGEKGADGKTSYTHIAYADTANGDGFSQEPTNKAYIGVYVDFNANDSSDPSAYAWSLIKGADGLGIRTTTITYAGSTSGTAPPASGWTAQVPSVPEGQFLWTKTLWTYTDDSTETGYSVAKMGAKGNPGNNGIAGKDGVGISETTITYAGSVSGTMAPSSGWTSAVPSVPEGQFLWTKTIWHYTDNTTETGYSVAKMGDTGATGVGVTVVYRYYCLQASKPAKPTTLNPGTSWTLVEPTYTEGSTNNLYTTDLVVYSDDTFIYSDVSLSSSYKAAKDAYNKAINAQALANAAKDAAAAADILARAAQTSANSAKTTADGKNTVFYATTAPATAGRKINDIWFDTANGNSMYYFSGTAWTLRQFGTNALANLSITNALIANAAIDNAKIANLDAGKITTGIISADRIGAGTLTVGKLTEAALTEIQKPAVNAKAVADAAANAAATAQVTADTAKTNAATAQSAADAAKATLAAWCYNNNLTYIDGGDIYTGTITAAQIAADAITADKIAAGAITADKFYGTAITSNNYVANSAGMKINLANGTIDTKNFKVDSAGNVAMTGTLTMQGAQTLKICNNSAVEIASLKYESINWNGKTFDSAKLYGKTNVDLAVGSTSNNVECQVRMMAGAYAPIACGQRSNGQIWVSLTGSGGVIGIDPLNSPAAYATGCTKEVDFTPATGFTKLSGYMNKIVYNAMGKFCFLAFTLSGNITAGPWVTVLTLPAGYRPSLTLTYSGNNGNLGLSQIRINPNGTVQAWGQSNLPDISYTAFYYAA
jgi:trimeric autotransporter adhesin